ncbi:hypothetical protein BGZ97_000521, partial [Linnemannia gamsii]
MRITPDPLGSPSTKRASPSSSTPSLSTLANASSPRPPRTINPAVKVNRTMPLRQLHSQLLSASGADAAVATTSNADPVPTTPATGSESGSGNGDQMAKLFSISISRTVSLSAQEASKSSEASLVNNNYRFPLKVNTVPKPHPSSSLWRSQSSDALISPNQLQGVVIESQRTPINAEHPRHFHHSGIAGGVALSSGLNDTTNIDAETRAHGLVFEPSSPDQKDIPWMLYRQRSQSVGAISSSSSVSASAMRSGAGMVAGAAASMIASAFGNHVQSVSGSQDRQQQQQSGSARSIETPLGSTYGLDTLYNQSCSTPAQAPLGKKDVVVEMDVEMAENVTRTEQSNQPSLEPNTSSQSSSPGPVLLPPSTPVSIISSGPTVPHTATTLSSGRGGGPWSDEEDQSSSVSTDTEVEMESEVDDQAGSLHVHRPARRTTSSRTGGKSHYSVYRRRIQSISQLRKLQLEQQQQDQQSQGQQRQQQVQQLQHEQETMVNDFFHPDIGDDDDSTSSILAISTTGKATAKRNTQEADGTHSMHFFNRHLQRVQQQAFGGGRRPEGYAMDASSPSIFSNMILSPASCKTVTSIHSAMTTGSETSYASSTTSGFSAITGTTSSSVYSLSSSDPSNISISRTTTVISETSTLCGNDTNGSSNDRTPLRPRGVRRFFHWTCLNTSLRPFSSSSALKCSEKSGKPQDSDTSTPRRLTLQELSSRESRFFGKGQPTSTHTTAPRDPPRRHGKKGPRRPDAKAFFSNERTYMHWIKFGLLLGSMALTLLSFGKSMGLQVGLFLVLVAMSSLVYATTIFHLRDRWMKQFRLDVLYYDRVGPTVLFMALFLAFATNVT